MKLLWQYIKKQKKYLIGALIFATFNQTFALLDPLIIRLIIDRYATSALQMPLEVFLRGVLILVLGYMGVALISRIAKNFQDYFVNIITQRVGALMYSQNVLHSFSLPYSVFEDQRSGELLQKLQKARNDSQIAITSFINVVYLSFVGLTFILIYSFFVHWLTGLLFLFTIPIIGTTSYFVSRKIKNAQKRIVAEAADLAGSTTETLRNVELVKSLGLENQEVKRLNLLNERILFLELEKIKLIRVISFIHGTMINTARSLLLFIMLWMIFSRLISLGEFLSLFIYSFFIFNPLAEFSNVATQFQESKASMEQIQEILSMKPEEKPPQPQHVETIQHVSFRGVFFTYQSQNFPSLRNINFTIRAGDTIAFVGPSGCGKTTLVKLLVGLYKPSSGNIFFNDIPSMLVNFEKLRRKIGLVLQETQLFAGTIRENLLFVRPDATDQECNRVLELAAVTDILKRGKDGLDTKIGEGGIKISGGERQRLAIARALLRNPDLIIFDEATSNLDSITEKEITKTIREIELKNKNLITILIAHRLSTVAHAKKIYVLEKGKIIEQGTHDELLAQAGLYAALWREQSGHEVFIHA